MKIAYLGWGSLVWNPGDLLMRAEWFKDGPFLPVEFCRQSQDDRLTLVIVSGMPESRTLWALSSTPDLAEAIKSLQRREGLTGKKVDQNTGVWPTDSKHSQALPGIVAWAEEKKLDAVIWTALGPRFRGEDRCPTVEEAVRHLRALGHEKRSVAEQYVRRTPIQIDTEYRRRFELAFGWKPEP